MYISVDNYRQMYLDGKDKEIILEEIVKIRHEIAKAKNKLESPANEYDNRSYPLERGVVDVCRDYFEAATSYLSEITGEAAELTEEEKASLIFDSMVDDISCVTLTVGRYLQDKYELTFNGDDAELTELHLGSETLVKKIDSAAAKEIIRSLHIGEWKDNYTPEQYGCTLNEPTKWELRIDYTGGAAPRFYDGIGVFPYNFKSLLRLMNADIV